MSTNSSTAKPSAGIGVRYDETAALYTSQVVVNSIDDTILLECSSGFVRSDSGKTILPIEQRLAMSIETARKLGNLLLDVADEMEGESAVESEPESNSRPERNSAPAEIGRTWLSQAARLQHNMRRAMNSFPQWEEV